MCRLHLLITVSFSVKLFSKASLYIVGGGGHSIITLSQNDQNLDPPSPLFELFEFGNSRTHPLLTKTVNCMVL